MVKKAPTRRTLTTEHVRALKTLARKKTRAASIAKTLRRTEGATRQKAFSLGLSLDFGPDTSRQQAPRLCNYSPLMARGFFQNDIADFGA